MEEEFSEVRTIPIDSQLVLRLARHTALVTRLGDSAQIIILRSPSLEEQRRGLCASAHPPKGIFAATNGGVFGKQWVYSSTS